MNTKTKGLIAAVLFVLGASDIVEAGSPSGAIAKASRSVGMVYGTTLQAGDRELFTIEGNGGFCGISHFSTITEFVHTGYSPFSVVLRVIKPGPWAVSCISTSYATERAFFVRSAPALTRSTKDISTEETAESSDMLFDLQDAALEATR